MTDIATAGDELAEFRTAFFEECVEMLTAIDSRLGCLDGEPLEVEGLNEVFRAVHTIKGSAGFFNLEVVVNFAHTFETLLSAAREKRIPLSEETTLAMVDGADVLAAIIDKSRLGQNIPAGFGSDVVGKMEALLAAYSDRNADVPVVRAAESVAPSTERRLLELEFSIQQGNSGSPAKQEPLIAELERLGELTIVRDPSQATSVLASGAGDGGPWIVRLATTHSEEDIRQVFEFVDHALEIRHCKQSEPAGTDHPENAPPAQPAARSGRSVNTEVPPADRDAPAGPDGGGSKARAAASTIRVELARVDRLVNMVGELVITQAMLTQQLADQQSGHRPELRQGHEDLANYTRELQECVMAIRMQPVKSVFSRMPRLVREIAGKLGKKVRLVTSGEQTEVDKTVIEELADPLLHMIRNAIDHGIESVDKRVAAGKPEEGTVELSASQRGGNILITVSDDGAGIDRQRLRAKAIERGIVPADASLSGEEIDQLIFAPGFSTAEKVTDVSGRGVGMDVVRSNISNLGGRIQIQSTQGRGTKFTLVLPLTLAVLDGMLIAVGSETYILPLTNIVETIRPDKRVVRQLANGSTVVAIRGEFIRLVNLGALFGLSAAIQEPWNALVVVVELDNGTKLGVVVDELIGQRQVVVKSLQENFDPVPGISGATILGTGRVALILDIEQLSRLSGKTEKTVAAGHMSVPQLEIQNPTKTPELALA